MITAGKVEREVGRSSDFADPTSSTPIHFRNIFGGHLHSYNESLLGFELSRDFASAQKMPGNSSEIKKSISPKRHYSTPLFKLRRNYGSITLR